MPTRVLSELDARAFLDAHPAIDVPFVESHLVEDEEAAVRAAKATGFPVTLKGVAPGLAHKARIGAVVNDVRSEEELRRCHRAMATSMAEHGIEARGFMVQAYARAGSDVFLGAIDDAVFGVCAVIGKGGGSVETSDATRFVRAVDLDLDAVRSALEGVFGAGDDSPADGPTCREIHRIVRALAQLVEREPDVADVELNPVRVATAPEPGIVVLDALVTTMGREAGMGGGQVAVAPVARPPQRFDAVVHGLERALAARSVCLVGVSRAESGTGYSMLRMLRKGGYRGRISIVHPAGGEVHGIEALTTLSIDEIGRRSFDVALLAVGEEQFADVLEQLAPHDVGAVVGLTSPSGEGDASDTMEQAIVASVHPVVGPNTAGYVSMPARLRASFGRTVDMDAVEDDGNIALVTQSGSVGSFLLGRTFAERLRLRYWVPTGNELDVRLEHVLRAVADDHVDVIALFIEGIRDGAQFVDALRAARARGKLITAYGVGRTREGQRAAQSHTAAMGGDYVVLRQVLEREGVLVADDLNELFDLTKLGATTFAGTWRSAQRTWPVSVLSTSGGSCSITAEEFARHGRPLRPLQPDITSKLADTLPSYATIANPIDVTSDAVNDPTIFVEALDVLATSMDRLGEQGIVYLSLGTQGGDTAIALARQVVELNERTPMRLVVSRLGPETLTPEVNATYRAAGIPVYGTPNQAVNAICRLTSATQAAPIARPT